MSVPYKWSRNHWSCYLYLLKQYYQIKYFPYFVLLFNFNWRIGRRWPSLAYWTYSYQGFYLKNSNKDPWILEYHLTSQERRLSDGPEYQCVPSMKLWPKKNNAQVKDKREQMFASQAKSGWDVNILGEEESFFRIIKHSKKHGMLA